MIEITNDCIPGRRFRPPYPAGSCRKDAEKSPYPVGKHRKFLGNGSSIPAGSFLVNSFQLPVLSGRKRSEIIRKKSEKVPVGILLPSSGVFPVCSTGMRRKYNGSSQFLLYVFALGDH